MSKNEKKSLKNFFKVLKSTPQTLEEAKQKSKNLVLLMCGITLVFCVLVSLLLHILFGAVIAVVCLPFCGAIYLRENQRNKRNFCSACGAKMDYENGVAWKVTECEDKDYSPNPSQSGSKKVIRKKIATVEFTCTCVKCGNQSNFSKKFDIAIWYDNGTLEEKNLETLAKNYFDL